MSVPVLISLLALFLAEGVASGQEQLRYERALIPQSTGIKGNFFSTFQSNTPLKRPDGTEDEVFPFHQYLELGIVDPKTGLSLNYFGRTREVLDGEDRTFDVFNAFIEYVNAKNTLQVRLGRQILTESTNFVLLDGGLLRLRPLEGFEFVAYGGYQDRDAQPDPEEPLRSFGIFGVNLKSKDFLGAIVNLGYEGIEPDDFSGRHFLNFTFNRVVPYTNFADVYSRVEFDLEEGNLALFTLGTGVSPFKVLHFNIEYGTYKPDDDRDEFLQDPIFDIFSVSRLHELRAGLTYYMTDYLEVSGSYSFARYDFFEAGATTGNIARLGFDWDFWRELGLRAFQGIYFIKGRDDDRALGTNLGVSQEIYRGWELTLEFAYANFETVTNKDGNAFSYIMGTEYLLVRDLALRGEVEINTNPDFERDVRTNLGVSYYF